MNVDPGKIRRSKKMRRVTKRAKRGKMKFQTMEIWDFRNRFKITGYA